MLRLVKSADAILTNSGGLQEKAAVLGERCITFRENTERSITGRERTNTFAGVSKRGVLAASRTILGDKKVEYGKPVGWDELAAERIVADCVVHVL